MREENMTFGQYIRAKRKASSKGLTLRDVAKKLGISLTMYCDIERNRRSPNEDFDYEGLANMLELNEDEKARMYDLAAIRLRTVPSDIEDVMMYSESGSLARMALRMTNSGMADAEDWKKFIWELERKQAAAGRA